MYYFNIWLLHSGTLEVNLALPWLLEGEESKREEKKHLSFSKASDFFREQSNRAKCLA